MSATTDSWVIVIGELSETDATAIRLDQVTIDGERMFPVFGNPEAARAALAGKTAAERALQIRVDLLRESLPEDAVLLFDSGDGNPKRIGVADLERLQAEEG